MMDRISVERRSENMRRIRDKDTAPEMLVRRLVHNLGYRYRLHAKDLPGKPDLVFRGRKKAIFVHGCFWHFHSACREGRIPGSRIEFWEAKLRRNQERDQRHLMAMSQLKWKVLVIWECEIGNTQKLKQRLQKFLSP